MYILFNLQNEKKWRTCYDATEGEADAAVRVHLIISLFGHTANLLFSPLFSSKKENISAEYVIYMMLVLDNVNYATGCHVYGDRTETST